jgi:hypothetical protein
MRYEMIDGGVLILVKEGIRQHSDVNSKVFDLLSFHSQLVC